MKISFENDYSRSAHPAILKALAEDAESKYSGYGVDPVSDRAAALIREACKAPNALVQFVVGGTQCNSLLIDIALRSFEGVVCADTGHINVHEAGAIEFTGHKVMALPSTLGKISAEQVEAVGLAKRTEPQQGHVVEPQMVYLSQPTEVGTLYSLEELTAISKACRDNGFYLYVDGARMSYALASEYNDVTLEDLARLTDAFYIGGTKCGMLIGEALVILNDALKPHFFSYQKQHTAHLAKGWLLGLQFETLFKDGLYVEIAKKADLQAMRIRDAFLAAGIKEFLPSPTNQQFFILTEEQFERFSEKYVIGKFMMIEEGLWAVRFCTSWYTKDEEVDTLCKDIPVLVG